MSVEPSSDVIVFAFGSTDFVLKKISDLMPKRSNSGDCPFRHRLQRVQPPDRIGVGDLGLVEHAFAGEEIAQHEGNLQRRDRAFMRNIDVDDDLTALEVRQRVTHLAGAIEIIEPMGALGHTGDIVRPDARAGGDDQEVVVVGLAGLRRDRLFVSVDVRGRIDHEADPAVEHFALVAEQLRLAHAPERDVEQAGLIHVGIGSPQHRQRDAARRQFFAQLPAQSVGDDGAGETAADNKNFLRHLLPPLVSGPRRIEPDFALFSGPAS